MWVGASPTRVRRCVIASRTAAAMSSQRTCFSPDGAVPWPGKRSPITQ